MALREELQELHWSYMEGYAAEMVARGPTLTDDGETAPGSVHIVGLSGPSAARGLPSTSPTIRPGCTATLCCALRGRPACSRRSKKPPAAATWAGGPARAKTAGPAPEIPGRFRVFCASGRAKLSGPLDGQLDAVLAALASPGTLTRRD
jgi:hypothetical protein